MPIAPLQAPEDPEPDRPSLLSRVPMAKSSDVLIDRADELRKSLGYTETVVDHRSGFYQDTTYLKWADENLKGAGRWSSLRTGRPAALAFWYRTSPMVLVPRMGNNGLWCAFLCFMILRGANLALRLPRIEKGFELPLPVISEMSNGFRFEFRP